MGFFENLIVNNQPLLIFLCILIICVALAVILFTLFRRSKTSAKGQAPETSSPEDLIGKSGVVVERVDGDLGTGLVEIEGEGWAARAVYTDEVLEVGTAVSVLAIEGVKLIVHAEA